MNLSTFFRVFDVAFFAPGTILVAAVYLIFEGQLRSLPELGLAQGVVLVLVFAAVVFCTGLVIHSMVWFFRRMIFRHLWNPLQRKWKGGEQPFPLKLDKEHSTDLILYFWYLRATCWNVAFTLVVVSLLIWNQCESVKARVLISPGWIVLGLVLASAILLVQGLGFHAQVSSSLAPPSE